jgi:hypothetical protein
MYKKYTSITSTYQIVDFFKVKRSHIPAIALSHFKIIDNYLYAEFFMTPSNGIAQNKKCTVILIKSE